MDISIELDQPSIPFTTGDTVKGCVVILCSNTAIVISKISVNLIGETTSILTDTTGIFMNTKEEEKHCILHKNQVLLPHWNRGENTSVESLKLGFGYHRFAFALKIPRFPACLTCPPNSPVFNDGTRVFGSPNLPPSMMSLVKGAEVSHKIDVAVTTYRNLFKSTARKIVEICVWPNDSRPDSILDISTESFPSTKSVTASILGPPGLTSSASTRDSVHQLSSVLEPTRLLITAGFPQDYHLSSGPLRHVTMRLVAERLNHCAHSLYIASFQLLLFGYTDIRAGSASSGQMSSWMIQSLSNLDLELSFSDDATRCDIDPNLWRDKYIPETAVPSFETCNIFRKYEFEILLGLQCKHDGKAGRVSVVQLRVPVKIGSGFSPGRTVEAVGMAKIPIRLANDVGEAVERTLSTQGTNKKEELSAPPTYQEAITMYRDERRSQDPRKDTDYKQTFKFS